MKKLVKVFLLSLTIAGITFSGTALGDITLNITGTIKASPCEVDAGSDNTINVDLGKNIEATKLAAQDSYTDWVPVTILLKNCPATTTAAIAKFTGTPATATGAADMYENTGSAKNVQIELQDSETGASQGNNSTMEAPVSASAASFALQARAYSVEGGATPGNIAGSVQVSFTYQ
ncbi:fimbrial protein [Kalamiella sp. sgz302252]|uniref:fimbrial protein n=1 Tax=Pantoea sp. sgz302252 TaxID=3341827 RepID=UPI0036D2E539